MKLPDDIRFAIRDALHAEPTDIQAVGGGMINQSARVEVNGAHYFVKWKANAPPSFFEVEARGLRLLRATGALRVPQVIVYGESPAYLILEWIESAARVDERKFTVGFGQALAALHRVTGAAFGLDHDNFIGGQPQRNTPGTSWPQFYRDQRIAAQMELARSLGRLPPQREALLNGVIDRMESILDGSGNPPSLIHGDLWSGNYFVGQDGAPVVVDPAVYYGDREVEMAFTQLFGGFPAGFIEAYHDAYPLDTGYEYRRPLLQLYPMLVHLNHFGEAYGSGVDAICRRYF
jgi:fructosamine-3-kinase